MDRNHPPRRSGFTIVELVVTMALLGLLIAMVLPSVQRSRASSQRVYCQNNLKQFGLAMHQHCETHGRFPTGGAAMRKMLPGLGQGVLYDQLQNQVSLFPGQSDSIKFSVPVFVCPSDPLHKIGEGNSNYYLNEGTILHDNAPTNGFDQVSLETRPSSVTDGMSQSAAISERLVGLFPYPDTSVMEREPRRFFWFTRTRYDQPGDELLAVRECRDNRTTTFPQYYSSMMFGYHSGGRYLNHLLRPNEAACYNGPEDFQMTGLNHLIPSSSLHDGGVNILFIDGSVKFVNENLDEGVWRAIGTINGGEENAGGF